jgi:hypothetical protein
MHHRLLLIRPLGNGSDSSPGQQQFAAIRVQHYQVEGWIGDSPETLKALVALAKV